MNESREIVPQLPKNPFEKVTAEQLNHDLIGYLFAKPVEAIYDKLINRENYRIIGGWGSGKTMLLKYISFETQMEVIGSEGIRKADFIGIYMKIGQTGFKPFLKPGGKFKEGGEILFGHYLNLLILEKIISIIICGRDKTVFNIPPEEESNLVSKVLAKFPTISENSQMGFISPADVEMLDLNNLKKKIENWRIEIETFLNIRDLEKDLKYKNMLSVYPTSIRTFLNEVIQEIRNTLNAFSRKRFYVLLDECDLFSEGQQKVINTIIKPRFTTMVFKLASRPPDIKTMETIDEGVGLTDREIKKLYLDEMYNPASASYRNLCYRVAEKRFKKYGYPIRDIRKILGKYTIEDEIGRDNIESYLIEKYPNKQRVETKFKEIYKDFKVAATFQILRNKREKKKYADFNTFVMLSSGIMLHFLELCRDTFNFSIGKKLIVCDEERKIYFKQVPLPTDVQSDAAYKVSQDFYRNIEGRAKSLKDTNIDMEFGDQIQKMISVLTGLFRKKLMTFNEPEAARIEIPEGKSALDNSLENPIQQIFETAISISVFQEGKPYMPKQVGGIRPPTYILNRILTPYPERISPSPRWRTKIHAETFNKILKNPGEVSSEVLGKKKGKKGVKRKTEKKKKEEKLQKGQLTLPLFQVSETMPVLGYLNSIIKNSPFKEKTLIVLLHLLRDLIPFIEGYKNTGASPSNTIIFYKDYAYPRREEIENYLKKEKYKIYPLRELYTVLKQLQSTNVKDIIVIEDGGHIVPRLHSSEFKGLTKITLGAVEQTTKGIRNDKQIDNILFPVISIPGSKLKDTFEPPHVARAVINNIQKLLPEKNFSGRKALLIGFGNIGEQIAYYLRNSLSMQVTIYDSDTAKLIKAQQYGFNIEKELEAAVKEKYLIVGATGETVIGRSEILAMVHNTYLISASSEQWEFCIFELDALSSEKMDLLTDGKKIGIRYKIRNTEKYVNLIADGYPINFWETESMPNEVSDLIMSLIFISAVEIATNQSLSAGINIDIINELDKKYDLSKLYLEYHK